MIHCHSRRTAFTIVDVLVSMGVVGLLISLLLPAVASSRESSRRVACINNLRQIGSAAHAHESVHRKFPFTTSSHVGPRRLSRPYGFAVSPHTFLTATLAPPVFHQIDFDDVWFVDIQRPSRSPSGVNGDLAASPMPVFRCPSDRHIGGSNNYRANLGISIITRSDSSRSNALCLDERNGQGAFEHGRELAASAFVDGLSNTAFFSEKVIGDFNERAFTPFTDRYTWYVGGRYSCETDLALELCQTASPPDGRHVSYSGWTWMLGGFNSTWYNHLLGPNPPTPDCQFGIVFGGGRGVYSARSHHLGGVNVLFADGATKFISEDIDLVIWRALGTRNGREVHQ
jgi:prepilin-type processing-associated H-X9-DG protein